MREACTSRAVFSASSASCQVSIELFTWKPPMTRPTSTGMSRIALSLVATRQLRGDRRPPLGAGAAVGSGPGTGAGAAVRDGGVKLPRADGSGLLPAVEVLVSTSTIQRCIEEPARTAAIPQAIAEGRDMYGMQTFDQCVLGFYQKNMITYEEALRASSSPTDFEVEVQRLSMSATATAKPAGAAAPAASRPFARPPGR